MRLQLHLATAGKLAFRRAENVEMSTKYSQIKTGIQKRIVNLHNSYISIETLVCHRTTTNINQHQHQPRKSLGPLRESPPDVFSNSC